MISAPLFQGDSLMLRPLAALAATVLFCLPALSQPAEKWSLDRTLTISPKAAAVPELQYRLFPLVSERKPGNAAPIYLRFAQERPDAVKKDMIDKIERWLDMPLDQLPKEEMKKWLEGHSYNFKQLDMGARRTSCDWNYILEVDNLFNIRLGDAQEMRGYASLLAIKARFEIATGDNIAALRTLETGFAFAQHVGEGPFLINALVAMGCANVMADRL